MVNYRRSRVAGGTYFFTLTLRDRRASTLTDHVGLLVESMRYVRHNRPFQTLALVVLPDHLHAIWRLPDGDSDYSMRWHLIKARFSRRLQRLARMDGVVPGWQPRFWEHRIRDSLDLQMHFDYVHFNPLKHGLVATVADWRFSTFHRCVRQGLYPEDWAMVTTSPGRFGE